MKKIPVGVIHYWAKTVNAKYGGLGEQLVIELFIAIVMGIITVYCYLIPALGLFFAAFIIPTLIFTVGALLSTYHTIVIKMESRKKTHQ